MSNQHATLPILYSLNRCPYAMRARFALLLAQQPVIIRTVTMQSLPQELIELSPKSTVPVLWLPNGQVIDESWDIMTWALERSDPLALIHPNSQLNALHCDLVDRFDKQFIPQLDRYKVAARYHHADVNSHQKFCWQWLNPIIDSLEHSRYLTGNNMNIVDIALLPFIRQLAQVNKPYFRHHATQSLQRWLTRLQQAQFYMSALQPYPTWVKGDEDCVFSEKRDRKTEMNKVKKSTIKKTGTR